jgi:hypothetical protein
MIAYVVRLILFERQPLSECRREVRIDEKFHRSEAAKTGWSVARDANSSAAVMSLSSR